MSIDDDSDDESLNYSCNSSVASTVIMSGSSSWSDRTTFLFETKSETESDEESIVHLQDATSHGHGMFI